MTVVAAAAPFSDQGPTQKPTIKGLGGGNSACSDTPTCTRLQTAAKEVMDYVSDRGQTDYNTICCCHVSPVGWSDGTLKEDP